MQKAADRICTKRKTLGLTQEEFAARLGVHQTTVARWETGVQVPRQWRLDQIEGMTHDDKESLATPAARNRRGVRR